MNIELWISRDFESWDYGLRGSLALDFAFGHPVGLAVWGIVVLLRNMALIPSTLGMQHRKSSNRELVNTQGGIVGR